MNTENMIDSVKTSKAYYTEEKMINLANNLSQYGPANEQKMQTVKTADIYLEYGVHRLMKYITGQNIPRSYGVNQKKGCPVCKKRIDRFGNYPYTANPLEQPFKITCPSCDSIFPSNDFDSYYKSGLDENGRFDPKKADGKYLVNELYKEHPSDWCVDDGFGWIDPEGIKTKSKSLCFDREKGMAMKDTTIGDNRYTFIAYYNHWYIWSNPFKSHGECGMVTSAISVFRDAYLYTKNKKYAVAGITMLHRVASLYPEYDACIYKWEDNFRHSGGAYGKIIGSIWERNIVDNLMKAYDAFFDAIDHSAVSNIRSHPFYKNDAQAPESPDDIKKNIENNLLRQILIEVKEHRIRGNVGMHQSCIALAALILQDPEYFDECIDFILSTTDKKLWGCGNILRIITDEVDHDGCGNETSANYNGGWLNGIHTIAEIIKDTPRDLYKNPKFLKMFHLNHVMLIANKQTLNIGDTNKAGDPVLSVNERALRSYLLRTKCVKTAQLLHLAEQRKLEQTDRKSEDRFGPTDLFEDKQTVDRLIDRLVKQNGPYRSKSKNYSGYGLSKLELHDINGGHASAWLYYGRNTGHGHRDTLMLGLYGFGVFLNPDSGYPVYADGNPHTRNWDKNSISHDTTTVDARAGDNHVVGIPLHFHAGNHVGVFDAKAPHVYPHTDLYRRTCVVIHMGGTFYVVDFFRVFGGDDHRYVFHGAYGEVQTSGLCLVEQKKGTYAGQDVPYADADYDDTHKDGFNYLYDVKTDPKPTRRFCVDWKIRDQWGVWEKNRNVHLSLSMADPVDEVSMAKGKPPQNKPGNPPYFDYMIARKHGKNRKSLFTSVIHGYEDERSVVESVTREVCCKDGGKESVMAKAVRITLADGRTDYVLHAIDDRTYVTEDGIEFTGFLSVLSEHKGILQYAFSYDNATCKVKARSVFACRETITGSVIDFTEQPDTNHVIRVKADRDVDPMELEGLFVDIKTDGIRNGYYEIESAERNEDGSYNLCTGDVGYIRCYKDPNDFEKGYVYNIEKGAAFRIAFYRERAE